MVDFVLPCSIGRGYSWEKKDATVILRFVGCVQPLEMVISRDMMMEYHGMYG